MFLVTKLMLTLRRHIATPENVKYFLKCMQVVVSQMLVFMFSPISPGQSMSGMLSFLFLHLDIQQICAYARDR